MDYGNGYINGYIERVERGRHNGYLSVEGIDLSPVFGVYFNEGGKSYLWLRRKPVLEYDKNTETYTERKREPRFEVYMEKQVENNNVAYKGEFFLFHFKFRIVGIWDNVLGIDKQRLNLFVERLPLSEQTIIKGINERKRSKAVRQ